MNEELAKITEEWDYAKRELEVVTRDVQVLPDGNVSVSSTTFYAMLGLQAQIKKLEQRIIVLRQSTQDDYMLWPPIPEPRKIKRTTKPTQHTPRKVRRYE